MNPRIKILECDITRLEADAIVNAANTTLLGGGGVDGAIHRAAGPGLLDECRKIGVCPTGEARITAGHDLSTRHVIHTVGPVWNGGERNETGLLASCYRNSLQLAADHNLRTVAFPAISCGVYRFPVPQACKIALQEIRSFLKGNKLPEKVILACFNDEITDCYFKLMGGD